MLEQLRKQSLKDSKSYFEDPDCVVEVPCPACGTDDAPLAFDKNGFTYRHCSQCASLFVSPRPTVEALNQYYTESEAGRLRVAYFTEESAQARMLHVVQSRVDWIAPFLDKGACRQSTFVDVATLYPQLFSEMRRMECFDELFSADPADHVAELVAAEGVKVGWPESATAVAVTAFEQLEHQVSPAAFLGRLRGLLAEGGSLFLTTRTVSGFDLQVLWDSTPYIFVPEHLNLLSIEGLETLFDREGFELLELSTPGQLDVELVREAARSNEALNLPRFVRSLLDREDANANADLQAFLQKHRLSSHVRIAARGRVC
jgi:hypothetical protein